MDLLNKDFLNFLKVKAYNLRKNSILSTTQAGSGHPTSALSAADIAAVLFFDVMKFDPNNFENPNNDRFILSKGHAAPLLYSVYKELGKITQEELLTLREFDSVLEGHPTPRFKFSEAATGSLGQGLSIGAGIALSAKMDKRDFYTYVLLGDSEVSEGSIWEAAELSAYYKLNNLIAILDVNRLGQRGPTMFGHNLNKYKNKFEAFGWNTILVDGHSIKDLVQSFNLAKESKEKPIIIIAETIKGYGVDSVANKNGYHGKAFLQDELGNVLTELKNKFSDIDFEVDYNWKPNLPKSENFEHKQKIKIKNPDYKVGEKIATRKAYGHALVDLGLESKEVVALDAEVKNSTYSKWFDEKFPDRFVECFIAEQNMVGMAVGLQSRGKNTFSSTFGAFFTRAFDQIRMAAIGRSSINLVGSHAGVSIGQDGPSQMALEDISMMNSILNSIIFYPSDAVSTHKLVEQMANSEKMCYMRTTRMDTPVIYSNNEEFKVGGCKVLKSSGSDKALVVAAGVTLHEALKAYDYLKKQGTNISVIDLYSVKPFDRDTILETIKKSNNNLIVVEDHYPSGGIGETLASSLINEKINFYHLSVNKMPRSGSPKKLLEYEDIDSQAIINLITNLK